MNLLKLFFLIVLSALSMTVSCMEISTTEQMQAQSPASQQHIMLDLNAIPMDTDISNLERKKQKLETLQWLRNIIQPLNGGRYNPLHKGAQVNCTLIAEKCAKVLAGLDTPSLVLPKREDLDITFRETDQGSIVYHEVIRKEQAELVSPQQFIETVDILEDAAKAQVDLTQPVERNSLKYITSTLSTIAEDIQAIAGSALSGGKDKILCGLIYYYYTNLNAGHLANFYRDKHGNIFFVDAQSESITEAPPTRILGYELRDEVFFYALIPKGGYFIKKEPRLLQEQPDIMAEDTYIKFHLKDEEIQEQTDSVPDTLDQEESEENSIEDDTSTGDSDSASQRQIIGRKRKRKQGKPYTCDQCNKTFTQSSNLNTHKRIHTGEKPHKCDQCNKAFTRKDDLKRHILIVHAKEKPYKCGQCDYSTACSGDLDKHNRIHTGEKPYKCDQCDKAFTFSSNLNIHKRIHAEEKPYQCDQCDYNTAYASALITHKRIHTGEKPYNCDQCDKSFTDSGSLRRHKRVHTGEKPHKCDQCDKAFTRSYDLERHRRIHTGEKPHKCDRCDKAFADSSHLKRHKLIHIGEKPFACDLCDYASTNSSNLKIHKRTHAN